MTLLETLVILAVIILIVWWALRQSTANSGKEAPTSHGHGEHELAALEAHEEALIDAMPVKVLTVVPSVGTAQEPELVPEPVQVPEPIVPPALESVDAPVAEVIPDNLVLIEGIGPRISGILKTAGVMTFAQLAKMEPEQIKAILAGVDERLGRIADPTTWPQQAELAAKGEMEALQRLQDSLKAGKAA